jgi:hypothetical protein
MAARYPQQKTNLEQFEKYNRQLSVSSNLVIFVQYLLVSGLYFWTSLHLLDGPYWLIFGTTIVQIITVMVIGMVLDGSRHVRNMEAIRFGVTLVIIYSLSKATLISSALFNTGLLYLCVSNLMMWFVILREDTIQPKVDDGLNA